ncbi:MAG: SgcJ/EcaC family oxidoreductase [Haliscomenobacteraceae bacterium CHB4]|nr:hypothetical protein [Saprospiraceae bacterium]MCE7921549.1 SgcJ/EcaC family oxidoreductase [Haliscomenobacteraceae bacterium CHB4]
MKNILFSFLTLCAFALFTQTAQAQTAADEQAVRNTLNKGIEDYYTADVDKMVAYYAENATMVVYTGQKISGKAAIRQAMTEMLKMEKPTPGSFQFTVSNVRFLDANTALVVADLQGKSQVEGKTIEWTGVNTMVLFRTGGKWLIELESNIPVMPAPGN